MISLNWVSDYVDINDENPQELANKITKSGVNIEKVISNRIDNLVVGEIKECREHPNSDHLHICLVDIGSDVIQIVCGAPNVRVGLKVLVALPGCILPGNILIKSGEIRGEKSNGMLCALFELGLEAKTDENYQKGIAELDNNLIPGDDANKYLGTDDTVYEIDVHKHRNNDCYYHIGFAYEIASILNKKVTLPDIDHKEINESVKDYLNIKVDTDKCTYYNAKMVKNVTIKESPDFIKKRLISSGMRSINNVVDISNYVMLEYGQPLHFFDADKLGNNILVRNAKDLEEIVTIDGTKRILSSSDIVITNGLLPVCIAGVMGGENTQVDLNTKNIIIESAIFDSISIRNTSARLNLRSEASLRYGKGLNYEYTDLALERACYLLEKYADAEILKDKVTHDKVNKENKIVTFKKEEVNTLLGLTLTDEDISLELDRLMFPYIKDKDIFTVTIPNRRLDIDPYVNDIAEEIGRLYGYHNLKSSMPKVEIRRGRYVGDVLIRKQVSSRLRTLGLNEVKTYTLTSPDMAKTFMYDNKEQIILPNPMSIDKSVVRTSIIPSLINVYEYNKARKVKDILLYEISKTYDKYYNEESKISILMHGNYIENECMNNIVKCDFYVIKGIISNLLKYLGFKNRYTFIKSKEPNMHPGMTAKILIDKEEIGIIGRVHPNTMKDEIYVSELSLTKLYNLKVKPLKFIPSSIYPEIVKDVAFIIPNSIECETIRKQIISSGGRLLVSVNVFDLYSEISPGYKSIAYKLTFKDSTRTLTDDEVMTIFNKIINDVTSKYNVTLRDN